MIPKSGNRFSGKIVLYTTSWNGMAIRRKVIPF